MRPTTLESALFKSGFVPSLVLILLGAACRSGPVREVPSATSSAESAPPIAVAPASPMVEALPPDSALAAMIRVPIGATLAQWRATEPGDRILSGEAEGGSGYAGQNSAGPLVGAWCARATRQLRQGPGWVIRRQVYFFLRPPPGLPARGAEPSSVRDRYCYSVVVALEIVGDSADAASERSGFQAIARWNTEATTASPGPLHPAWRVDKFDGSVAPDGTGRGQVKGKAVVGDATACIESDERDIAYEMAEGPDCLATFRIDTAAGVMGISGSPHPHAFSANPSDGPLAWLTAQARFLPADDRALLRELSERPVLMGDAEHEAEPDDPFFRRMLGVRHRLVAVPPPDDALALAIVDAMISRGLRAGVFGPPLSAGPEGVEMMDSLGARMRHWHQGAFWEDFHPWADSALRRHPERVLAETLFTLGVEPISGCDPAGRLNAFWGISSARPFTASRFGAPTRARAWLMLAQHWGDSAWRSGDREKRRQAFDSVATSLRAGLETDPNVPRAEAGRHALWRAAAGLMPVMHEANCSEGD